VNNHSYKKYTASLEERKKALLQWLEGTSFSQIEVLSQDDKRPLDYSTLLKTEKPPFCAIAGHDAYLSWEKVSSKKERALWKAIAVVPRGSSEPVLQDENAFLLQIEKEHKHTSSSGLKKAEETL
jgi:hypothetical protein